ncbi:hypothetical protein [Thalassomonas actiniarum]|uniref:Uncharacterized protein n=1 Tax=Thalassomonas actiniarum TaxID=485447 RepID=A0AAE9YW76_9GAMM|nr:hypothetical protein [Thalassomonas actiniarum]WDE02411.1 hypothetical protein SG35_028785 [Thalassomonas actiniarum]
MNKTILSSLENYPDSEENLQKNLADFAVPLENEQLITAKREARAQTLYALFQQRQEHIYK